MLNWINSVLEDGGPRIKAVAYGVGIISSVVWLTMALVIKKGEITSTWVTCYGLFLGATVTAYVGSKLAEK